MPEPVNTPALPALFARLRMTGSPLAHPDSVVVRGPARFTVLTPRLVRMEWSTAAVFEDRGTYAFPTRYAAPPPFATHEDGGVLTLDTGALVLRYGPDTAPFDVTNLTISFTLDGAPRAWAPGLPNPRNLCGTRRTLDGCAGDAALGEGLLSRDGWALVDDSRAVVFDGESGWVTARPHHAVQDWYFFGYGHDYRAALADYTRFGGPVPLIPRFVLGAWWSRYWAYSARDLQRIVRDFRAHALPLDVLVLDMDWHTSDSWTGYTWNRKLFPDPAGFLAWVHKQGLRTTLNLHPAEGVQPFEEIYADFATALGHDPALRRAVPFRIADKAFVRAYFELLHHPLEDQGVDFWWMDWQQGEISELPGLDPLSWINHLHFQDSLRRGGRPMLYSRWGGLGNHRYHIGFSGDTYPTWEALQFQPYFTATAGNVIYGWWSHDIGGHMGATDPELFARWVQFGALSPCLRLHATKDPDAERRPWAFPAPVFRAAHAAFQWRYALVPYLYTMARAATDTSIALCRPLYYDYPDDEAAYVARYQYFLGDAMIAAPIVHPADPATGLAAADVWVPPGTWIDYITKETFSGPRWVRILGDLDRMPRLMREGAILPLARPAHATDAIPPDELIIAVFPGPRGAFRLYEDDGTTLAYQEGAAEWTPITMETPTPERCEVRIGPVEGRCPTLPARRGYEVRLEGTRSPVAVTLDGKPQAGWTYDAATRTTTIRVPRRAKDHPVTITAMADGPISALGPEHNQALIRADLARLLGERLPPVAWVDLPAAAGALAGPGQADALARLGGPFVHVIEYATPEETAQQLGCAIVAAPADGSVMDVEATWTLLHNGGAELHTVERPAVAESLILRSPFAFGGSARTMRWTLDLRVTWQGHTQTVTHTSRPLFPTIPAWRVVVHNPAITPLPLAAAVDAAGTRNPALDWDLYAQEVARATSVNDPHRVRLFEAHKSRLGTQEPLAALAVTTITSHEAREARVLFGTNCPATLYLNGVPLTEVPAGTAPAPPVAFHIGRGGRGTESVRLRAGRNTLVVALQADPAALGQGFAFSAAVVHPDGRLMTDLIYTADPDDAGT